MCEQTDPGLLLRPGPRAAPAAAILRALWLCLALVALVAVAAQAQGAGAASRAAIWDIAADEAEGRIADPTTPTPVLEALRERLAQQRSEALEASRAVSPNLNELNSRLEALGPPPAEGASEAPEIAQRRQALNAQIAEAQVPIIEADEAYKRTNALIEEIDRIVRARFTAELRSKGPSPLRPINWLAAGEHAARIAGSLREEVAQAVDTPEERATLLRRLPINVMLAVAGIGIAFVLRRWLIGFVEARLAQPGSQRSLAWLVALRNVARLLVPAVGAGLLFAALNPSYLVGRSADPPYFALPPFLLALIWSGWLGASLFAPRLPAYRMLPVDDAEARLGAWLTLVLGAIVSLSMLLHDGARALELRPETIAVANFPLIVAGALALWPSARLIATMEAHVARAAAQGDQGAGSIAARFLGLLTTALRVVAVAAPVLAAIGYFAAARYLLVPTILTLGLIGSALVVFALLRALAAFLLSYPTERPRDADGGLMPVALAGLIVLAALPLLALIWGARPADLGELWTVLVDGITFGGIRISATIILKLAVVLAIGIAVTRLLQVLLRTSVLPRTRLDAGGRNAVLAGVGYVGFVVAGLAAVSAAGLDFSNIAIVAGALSVGIGFGLQNIVSNFVSGIILLVERPIKEGDWIEVGGFSGYVRGISVRSTEIETFDRASVILPNSDLIAGTVLNRTHKGMSGRLQVPVSVAYDADPKRVEANLLAIAEAHPLVLEDPAPRVLFLNLGPDTMDFELRCWLRDVNFSLSARSDMNFDILEALNAEGIRVRPWGRELPTHPPPAAPAGSPGPE